MTIYLEPELASYFNEQTPLFQQLMLLQGDVFRELEGRKTQRVILGNKAFFIKQHTGVGFGEIVKNLAQGKLPVISAKNEWRALQLLQTLGIDVPKVMAYGERGWNPASKQSFILLEEIANHESLEQVTATWQAMPPTINEKRELIAEVARIARIMHENGVNHRDFYLCHFLRQANRATLCLIDLHRAQIRRKTPNRWRIKDLAGLYFSSRDIGLTHHDAYRFIAAYRGKSIATVLREEKAFWQQVKERGEKLYRDHQRK